MNERPHKRRIFLSYAHADLPCVKKLYRKLRKVGLEPWLDKEDILGGEEWNPAIRKAIRESALFIVCLTNNSVNKRGTFQEEIKLALDVWCQKLVDDIFLIPVKLEPCKAPESLAKFQWIDLFDRKGFERLEESVKTGMRKVGITCLRSKPSTFFSEQDLVLMLRERDFPHARYNMMGKGLKHDFESVVRNGEALVIDHATNLIWQRSCSAKDVSFEQALEHIDNLNKQALAGYGNWRLPTLEEAMSLMENRRKDFLHIDTLFEPASCIWTSDIAGHLRGGLTVWVVNYHRALCYRTFLNSIHFVRGVT